MARGNPKKIPQSGNKLSKASCKVGTETRTLVEAGRTVESEALHQNLLRKSSMKLISTSSVSVVGHAAILAAIKKYVPSLIPSPYSSERLDVVKQLKRSKKMEVQTLSNQEDASSAISKING
eukprot:XP_019077563.1 PREDICTED: uncharacterized protein LOC104880365 isoform X2 [Vitis vinifera]